MSDSTGRAGDPPAARRPASILDVAAAAGVSAPTVSRVLTGAAPVSPGRRERVLSAIAQLGYRPSETARALVSGRPSTVAILSADTSLLEYSTTIRGVSLAARESGLAVAISVIDGSHEDRVQHAVDGALRQPLAGAVVLKFDGAGIAALAALPSWLPAVVVGGAAEPSVAQASLDERAGGAAVTRHLLQLGHRTVHHVSMPDDSGDGRTAGWRAALLEAGAPVPAVIPSARDARGAVAIGRRLAERTDVTAVFCGNDETAMGVIAGLVDMGVRVPDDVSVAGFDDHPLAAIWRPALTTVAQDFEDLGRRAFVLLADQLGGTRAPASSTALPQLIVRASTAAPLAGR